MPVFTQGSANPAALTVPDVYVNVQAPPVGPVGGAPSNILGIVGTANWGPVNSAMLVGYSQATAAFGPVQNRARDLLTHTTIAGQNGASIFALVRVTDGTDTAATSTIAGATAAFWTAVAAAVNQGQGIQRAPSNLVVATAAAALTLTAKYTGTRGNQLQAVFTTGSAANTFKLTLSLPGLVPETFDNIPISGATAPALATSTFAGGTDGATGVTSTQLLGVDGATRTGMYALRNLGCAVVILADCATPASWGTELAFALSESCEIADANVAGDTPASFATAATAAGVDNPWFKAFVGDWVYWQDTTNNVTRLVSPAAFWAGWKVANLPSQSALNKQLLGIVGTQRSSANQSYSAADLTSIAQARGEVITNPVPGGSYFGCRFGRNSSSDNGRHQDAYTTMTNFLALSLSTYGGVFVGRLGTPDEVREAQSSISAFLQGLQTPPAGPAQIGAFTVAVSFNNATGVQSANVQVQYLGVVEDFVISLTGGQTVQITSQVAQAA